MGAAALAAAGWLLRAPSWRELASRNARALVAVTGVGFYLLYEWCHLSYHQPEDGFVGRLGLVRVLRRHHQRHHHPALAKRYNFNVTFPIWDFVRGTTAPADATARA